MDLNNARECFIFTLESSYSVFVNRGHTCEGAIITVQAGYIIFSLPCVQEIIRSNLAGICVFFLLSVKCAFPTGVFMFSLLQCTREHISATWDATILEKKMDCQTNFLPNFLVKLFFHNTVN